MNLLEIFLFLTTVVSTSVAGGMVWYVRKVLLKMAILADAQKETMEEVSDFSEHLELVNSLDTFYGDPTLAALLEHTKNLSDSIKSRVDSVEFVSEEDYGEEEYESDERSVG